MTRSHNEEIVREDAAGPILENITISEEVQQEKENKDTASKPRLRLASSEPCILHAFNEDNQEPTSEEARQRQGNEETASKEVMAAILGSLKQISADLEQQNHTLDRCGFSQEN